MMKNILKIFLLLPACIGFLSCENFLTAEEENVFQRDLIENNSAFAQGVLINGYSRMFSAYQFEDVATDDAVTNDLTNGGNNYANFRRAATGEWSPFFDPTNIWNNSYNAIGNINYFLTFADGKEWSYQYPERDKLYKERFPAEARALRGYHYLALLSRYGGIASDGSLLGVPVTTTHLTSDDNWKIPRSSFQATLDQIYADLDYAITNLEYRFLPNDPNIDGDSLWVYGITTNRGRISGEIAKALKARAALLSASPAYNNGNYDTEKARLAATIAGELLKDFGGIGAFPPDRNFWDNDNDVDNPDIMWRRNHGNNRTLEVDNFPPTLYGRGRINPTQNLVDAFPMKNGYPITDPKSGFDPANPYANRDDRLGMNIIVNGASYKSSAINTATDSPNNNGLNKQPQYSTRTGYYLKKLMRENINLNPTSMTDARHFYTYIRWTEIYMIYAEAANEAWGPDADPNGYGFTARDIIAKVRSRGGITQPDEYLESITSKEDMRTMIRNERRLEFCFEGLRFWDLRRWAMPLNTTAKGTSITAGVHTIIDVESRDFQPYMIYCPIPYAEVLKYPELIQNKDW